MPKRHWVATGPGGQTVCSTKEAAVATLAAQCEMAPRVVRYLLYFGQNDLVSVEACDCNDARCHTGGLSDAA